MTSIAQTPSVVGQPEVVEDASAAEHSAAWQQLKAAATAIQLLQIKDGSIPEPGDHVAAREHVAAIVAGIRALAPAFPHDAEYLAQTVADLERWAGEGFGVPDFHDALVAFRPELHREDGLRHLVLFPMTTQNGSPDRLVEALIVEVIWPEFIAELEAGEYGNKLFVSLKLVDFTPGYDTNSAVLFPETVAMRQLPAFTWGAIFQDREAARFRRVTRAAADITKLELTPDAERLIGDQRLAEETFVLWDIIHDRTHMRGDLPFDPFMIKQRMPFFLYSLEELRCDLTAFRECVRLVRDEATDELTRDRAALAQLAILFDRLFRFPLTGTRVRNYDGLGGQLLFAWLHQRGVLHWTDTQLAFDWDAVPDVVVELSDAINELYWRSIDRPKTAHWLAAYELVRATVAPHPASRWARGLPDEVLSGPPKGFTDAVLDDEFPLSMFYEALSKKMTEVIESTRGITARDADAPAAA
ncbi:DUF6421 family protein [Homoserinibacter sp. YIM 151385]|uniref:DUF6421 family protein n=1 Tax=Homoserinibacter sp. YIM 151385 TaxID=2985506 RepID=UPI0022F09156|nr:DUF6421 family protein [Homoserinibacter sp. YIM 151385]WBU37326.1 DUF6421 family protein [Homoserinibacter sp. YIM 151385]